MVVKNLLANAGDESVTGLIPGSGIFPGEGNGNPLQHSCLENSMERGAWWVTVHGVAESDTTEHAPMHTCGLVHTHEVTSSARVESRATVPQEQ